MKDKCFGKNYSSFLDFTHNYERTSGIFDPYYLNLLVKPRISRFSGTYIILCILKVPLKMHRIIFFQKIIIINMCAYPT